MQRLAITYAWVRSSGLCGPHPTRPGAHEGKFSSDTTVILGHFSLSHRERRPNTDCQRAMRAGEERAALRLPALSRLPPVSKRRCAAYRRVLLGRRLE
jgi:hypothetical protein